MVNAVRMQLQQSSIENKPAFLGDMAKDVFSTQFCEKLGRPTWSWVSEHRAFREIVFPQNRQP